MLELRSRKPGRLEPGLYWWRWENGSLWKWTVVKLSYEREKLRLCFLGTDREELLHPFGDDSPLLGPPARL